MLPAFIRISWPSAYSSQSLWGPRRVYKDMNSNPTRIVPTSFFIISNITQDLPLESTSSSTRFLYTYACNVSAPSSSSFPCPLSINIPLFHPPHPRRHPSPQHPRQRPSSQRGCPSTRTSTPWSAKCARPTTKGRKHSPPDSSPPPPASTSSYPAMGNCP